jgi:hypothetical protein
MMGHLFGDIERRRTVGMFPTTSKDLSQNRIVWFLKAFWLFVETGKIPLNHSFHPRERIVFQNSPVHYKILINIVIQQGKTSYLDRISA